MFQFLLLWVLRAIRGKKLTFPHLGFLAFYPGNVLWFLRRRGALFSSQMILCSQMLLSIFMGKSFLNDENASFNLRSRNLYLLLSITKIFISFLKASFNLRSRNLYLLLSTIPTILKSFFQFGNFYKLLSSFFLMSCTDPVRFLNGKASIDYSF